MERKYLITGGSGFIGSNIAEFLVKNHKNTHILIRENSDLRNIKGIKQQLTTHQFDLTNNKKITSLFNDLRPDYVINCAEPGAHVSDLFEQKTLLDQSITIAYNLIDAMKVYTPTSLVHLCSSLIYTQNSNLITEKTEKAPISNKGLNKLMELNILKYYALKGHLPIKFARIFRAYGPKEQHDRLFLQLFLHLAENKPIKIASDQTYRSYTFIDDIVEAIIKITHSELPPGEEINLPGSIYNTHEIVNLLQNILGKKILLSTERFPSNQADRKKFTTSNKKALDLINWTPNTSIEEGLLKTYNWWRKTNEK